MEQTNLKPCPVCFPDNPASIVFEDPEDPSTRRLFSTDAAFNGPGKDHSVPDTYLLEDKDKHFWIHVFPICPVCCGTGVVADTDDFVQLQAEVAMISDNLEQMVKIYKEQPSQLREHADRINKVLTPLVIKRALTLVKIPAKHSYARYLSNLFKISI